MWCLRGFGGLGKSTQQENAGPNQNTVGWPCCGTPVWAAQPPSPAPGGILARCHDAAVPAWQAIFWWAAWMAIHAIRTARDMGALKNSSSGGCSIVGHAHPLLASSQRVSVCAGRTDNFFRPTPACTASIRRSKTFWAGFSRAVG